MNQTLAFYTLILFLIPPVARSQPLVAKAPEATACEIWGQVVGSARLLQEGVDIELLERGAKPRSPARQKAHVLANGNFEFRPVPTGNYQFRVLDSSGNVILEQVKSVAGNSDFILLIVRDPKSQLASRNTVSLSALQHKTPKRALDAFRAAQKARSSGDTQIAVEHLLEAIVIDSEFAEAHSDLAAIYAGMGHVDEALEHARTAFSLNPQLSEAGCNFALLLISVKRYQEAEMEARHMLSGSSYQPLLHGVLAISLIEQRKNIDEGLESLGQAAAEYPFFRLLAARALAEIKRPDLALIQVKKYLQTSAHDCERPDLEAWVAAAERQIASGQ